MHGMGHSLLCSLSLQKMVHKPLHHRLPKKDISTRRHLSSDLPVRWHVVALKPSTAPKSSLIKDFQSFHFSSLVAISIHISLRKTYAKVKTSP